MIVASMFTVFLSSFFIITNAKLNNTNSNEDLHHNDNPRIISGVDAPQGKYPSQVSIQINNQHICGGTILNKLSVLTAAHCFAHVKTRSSLAVVTSTVDLTKPGRRYKVAKVIVHKNYRPNDLLANDIAIVKVANPFSLHNAEGQVTISRKNIPVTSHSWGNVIGWGYTMANSGFNAKTLKEVEQQLLDYRDCSEIIGKIHPTQFCIQYPGNGKGICEGDSGGPVFSGGRQIGIMSWRDGNGPCGYAPAVATLLSKYIDWLVMNA